MTQHRDVTLDKIGYLMDRMGDDGLSVDDLESMTIKVFVASFEWEQGFEADLIKALVDARYSMLCSDSEGDDPATISGEQAEKWYVKCQTDMYVQSGCDKGYAEESASWPDVLPLHADWDTDFLRQLARKEVAHHLVVMDQLREEMKKHKTNE